MDNIYSPYEVIYIQIFVHHYITQQWRKAATTKEAICSTLT